MFLFIHRIVAKDNKSANIHGTHINKDKTADSGNKRNGDSMPQKLPSIEEPETIELTGNCIIIGSLWNSLKL